MRKRLILMLCLFLTACYTSYNFEISKEVHRQDLIESLQNSYPAATILQVDIEPSVIPQRGGGYIHLYRCHYRLNINNIESVGSCNERGRVLIAVRLGAIYPEIRKLTRVGLSLSNVTETSLVGRIY